MTTTEAARVLRCSAANVRKMCRRGRLPGAVRVGRDWFVPRSAIEQAKEREDASRR
jgi:excisionase family DNA binding protein